MPAGNPTRVRWFAAVLLAAAASAHADFKEDYSRGLAALKDGNYAEARQLLQKALAANPQAALRVRLYGQRWEPYLPQHYLGVAAFRMGDCAAALSSWNSNENKQTIGQLADLQGEQQRDIAECSKTALAKKDDGAAPKPAETKPPAPAAAPPATQAAPAETVAQKAAPAEAAPAKAPAADAVKTPAPPDAPTVAAARPAAPPPAATAADSSAATPPDSLIAAFDKYLAGRYGEVAAIDPNSYRDSRSRYHAYLLRAAARFTLSLVSGDQSLVEAARDDIKSARAANAKATPDATMFSPRFRTFFAQSR